MRWRPTRRELPGLAAVVAVLATVVGQQLRHDPAPPRPVREEMAAITAQTRAARAAATAAQPARSAPASAAVASARPALSAPLPPADTPLAQLIDELETRARAGDLRAACRLAAEADFCRRNPLDDASLSMLEASLANGDDEPTASQVRAIADMEDEQARSQRVCAGVPPARVLDLSWRHSLQVAQAGDDWFAVRFAHGRTLDVQTFLENPEPWQAYRRHAQPLLMRAAANGEPRALWMLWRIHAGIDQLVGMPNAIARDARLARVYASALRDVSAGTMRMQVQHWLDETRASASPAEWAEAERAGREMAGTQYAATHAFDPRQGTLGGLTPERCDELSVR